MNKAIPDPAVAAIKYAVDTKTDEGIEFLRCWLHGDFDVIRHEWPDCPPECFKGAEVAKVNAGKISAFRN